MPRSGTLVGLGLLFLASGCSSSTPDPIGQGDSSGGTPGTSSRGGATAASNSVLGGTTNTSGGTASGGGSGSYGVGGASSTFSNVSANGGNDAAGKGSFGLAGAARGGSAAVTVASSGGAFNSSSGRSVGGNAATSGKAAGGTNAAVGGATGGRTTSRAASGGAASGGKSTGGAPSTTNVNVAGGGGCLDGPAVVVPSGYKLVWADEFNLDGAPDSSNWGYESGFVRNEEAQWYQPDNAWIEQGCLIIEGRRERKTNPNYKAGSSDWKTSRQYAEYTSTSLRTMGKKSWQYGRLEMRGRIKAQTGLWPAWWTLGNDGEWPACGEVDIMEYYGGKIRANVACGTATRWEAKWDGVAWDVATFDDKNWENEFHIWRMDWDDTKIDLLLDDKLVNTSKLSDMLNADGASPFKQPHYMLINLAIGGQNGGDPAKTPFPTRYEVDYVRVYQKQ